MVRFCGAVVQKGVVFSRTAFSVQPGLDGTSSFFSVDTLPPSRELSRGAFPPGKER